MERSENYTEKEALKAKGSSAMDDRDAAMKNIIRPNGLSVRDDSNVAMKDIIRPNGLSAGDDSDAAMKDIIRLNGLSVGYEGDSIIENIDLEIGKGEIVTLIGPNGAGKSTILKTISKQLEPVSGAVYVSGRELREFGSSELAKVLSLLLTERIDPEYMTGRDIIETGRYPYTGKMGILNEKDHAVVDGIIKLLRISELAERPFRKLSDGQKQRILIGRALAQEPEILILDEPMSYLDIRHKLELIEILKKLRSEKNITIVMSLHEFELARVIADKVICVGEEGISRAGKPEDVLQSSVIKELYGITDEQFELMLQSMRFVL